MAAFAKSVPVTYTVGSFENLNRQRSSTRVSLSSKECLQSFSRFRVNNKPVVALPRRRFSCQAVSGVLTPELKEAIDTYVSSNKIVLFMKGNKMFPQCGFSNTCVQILNALEVPFETVNILENDQLRQGMKEYSSWPTFPQIYIDGEFFGGCDIAIESFQNGELKEICEKALLS